MPKFQVPADFNIGDPTNHENYRNGQSGLDALKKELDVMSGVYIIGIKANISDDGTIINRPDDEKKFIPFYAGQTTDLYQRIVKVHYPLYSDLYSDFNKELFNLSLGKNVLDIYEAMKYFTRWAKEKKEGGSKEKHQLYIMLDKIKEYPMLFFQCKSHLNYLLNLDVKNAGWYDFNHSIAYSTYRAKCKEKYNYSTRKKVSYQPEEGMMLQKYYEETKKLIKENFFFAYYRKEATDAVSLYKREAECKYFLEKEYGIYLPFHMEDEINKNRFNELLKYGGTNTFDFTNLDSLIYKEKNYKK